jgi:hypothetical protein
MTTRYKGDPYWMTAKYPGTCAKTGQPFKRGDRIFYYPRTKTAYAGTAAEEASREFQAAAEDEDYYNGQY